jgi:HEAT repeat protein
VPDKQQSWNDLLRLTNDKDRDVRSRAASALGSAFSHVPDKQLAWNDLL